MPVSPNLTIQRPESAYFRCAEPHSNTAQQLWDAGYDWVVTDDWESYVGQGTSKGNWTVVEEVMGYQGVSLMETWPFVQVHIGRRLVVLERQNV
jgi:hypothetical protein